MWVALSSLRKKENKLKSLFFDNFAPGTYFGWLYKVVGARKSLEFWHILKFSIKCTRILKIFVLNDPNGSWWPTENGKKNWKKENFDYLVPKTYFGWLYKVYEARTSLEFICILNYYIIGTRISKMFVFNDLSDSWWPT